MAKVDNNWRKLGELRLKNAKRKASNLFFLVIKKWKKQLLTLHIQFLFH